LATQKKLNDKAVFVKPFFEKYKNNCRNYFPKEIGRRARSVVERERGKKTLSEARNRVTR
jgi:hypothetical protein